MTRSHLEIESRIQEITLANGSKMNSYVSVPKGKKNVPAILVFQEAFGVNGHIRDLVDLFAKEGYLAIAPELFHRTAPKGFEGSYSDFDSVMPHYSKVTEQTMREDVEAVQAWLKSQPEHEVGRLACIGYCMGGKVSFIANSVLPLRAAISYYGGGIVDEHLDLAAKQNGPILLFWGVKDAHIPIEGARKIADALARAGKPHTHVEFSEAGHAFSNNDRPSNYNEKATRDAWALTLEFLSQNV